MWWWIWALRYCRLSFGIRSHFCSEHISFLPLTSRMWLWVKVCFSLSPAGGDRNQFRASVHTFKPCLCLTFDLLLRAENHIKGIFHPKIDIFCFVIMQTVRCFSEKSKQGFLKICHAFHILTFIVHSAMSVKLKKKVKIKPWQHNGV